MGKINEYSAMGAAPASNDLLFIGDTDGSPSYEIKSITIANLNKTDSIKAATSAGITITDDGGTYGIEVHDGGNVGIGAGYATTPTSYLDVRGASDASLTLAQFLNPSATTDGRITQILVGTDRADYKSLSLRYTYDTTNNDGLITLRHYEDATEGIHLKGDGNVGIGQTAPTSKLHIGDGSGTPSLRVEGASSYSTYLYTDGTNGPGLKGGAHGLHIQRGYGGGSGKNLYCFYSTSAPVTPLMIQSLDGNVGIGTNAPSGTLQIDSAVDDALYVHSTDVNKNARIKLAVTTSTAGFIEDSPGYIAISGSSTIAANNCLQISKGGTTNGGRISIGGTPLGTFSYAITTISSPATQASFTSSHTSRGYIYITNNQSATCQTAVVFGNETASNKQRWMCGQFWTATPNENYFGWHYMGGAPLAPKVPNSASFSPSGLNSNTVYCSQNGGMTSENTSVAFGHILTNGTGGSPSLSTTNLTSTYNMQSPVVLSAAGIATVTFTKTLTSASYTVMATGWDGTRPLVGYASTKAVGSVAITFYRLDTGAVVDLTIANNIELDFVIYGGSSSGVTKLPTAQTRLQK